MSQQRELGSITVVAPFFNEEAVAETFYRKLTEELDSLGLAYDLVFVDDGSTDETRRVLQGIAAHDSRVSVLALSRNFGHQAALTAGLDYATGDAVVVMDSDLQHPPATLREMVANYRAGADIVYAVRHDPERVGRLKSAASHAFYTLLRHLSDTPVIPDAADFRLMDHQVAAALRGMRETHRYLRGMAAWLGFKTAVVRYRQPERFAGKPGFTWRRSVRMAEHGLFSFTTLPLKFVTFMGLSVSLAGFAYLVYSLWVRALGETIPGWTSVVVVMLVLGGAQLLGLGIVAQYVGMLFEQVKNRPLYVLGEEHLGAVVRERFDHRAGGAIIRAARRPGT